MERTPWVVLAGILEKRAFAATWRELKAMKNELEADKTPAVMQVWNVQALAWKRRIEAGQG